MKHLPPSLSFALLLAAGMSAQAPPPATMPGLRLSLEELRAQYTHYGVGKRLKPKSWPNGARVAVALSFDVDNATVPLSRGQLGSEDLSRGMYGAVDGLPRILRVLERQKAPASFFIPAVSALLLFEGLPGMDAGRALRQHFGRQFYKSQGYLPRLLHGVQSR